MPAIWHPTAILGAAQGGPLQTWMCSVQLLSRILKHKGALSNKRLTLDFVCRRILRTEHTTVHFFIT
jgi:hypothetical protein